MVWLGIILLSVSTLGIRFHTVDVFHDWESSGGPRGRFARLGDVFRFPIVRNVRFDLPIVENVHPGPGFALPIVDFVHGHPVRTPNRRKRPRPGSCADYWGHRGRVCGLRVDMCPGAPVISGATEKTIRS